MTISVVIVLANWMDQKGRLLPDSVSRLDLAMELYRKHEAKVLVTSGWAYRDDSEIAIADAMKTHAVTQGALSSDDIIAERSSRDTVGDAVFTKRNVVLCGDPRINWRSIAVVTSDYHVNRAKEIFHFVYGEDYEIDFFGAKSIETDPVSQAISEENSIEAFRRTFQGIKPGDDERIYQRLCEQHPFYNGDVHSRI